MAAMTYARGRLLGAGFGGEPASPLNAAKRAAPKPAEQPATPVAAAPVLPGAVAASNVAGVTRLRLPVSSSGEKKTEKEGTDQVSADAARGPDSRVRPPPRRCASCGRRCPYCRAGPNGEEGLRRWRKVLYERQDFPDNFVDESFLSGLVTNAHVRPVQLRRVMVEATVVSQQVTVLTLCIMMFGLLLSKSVSSSLVIGVDIVLLAVGIAVILALGRGRLMLRDGSFFLPTDSLAERAVSLMRRGVLFAGGLLVLSPVLRTLTSAYSTDTIWALGIGLGTTHLAFFDYGFVNGSSGIFRGTVSLNAAVFSSVLLASRLEDDMSVYAFILLAFTVFAGFPDLARRIKKSSVQLHLAVAGLMTVGTAVLLAQLAGGVFTVVYCLSVFFITVVCPVWLKWVQRYKYEIQGPWDYNDEAEGLG